MKLSAILAPMIVAGVPGDVILATVKAFEDERADLLEKRRESDRNRQIAKRSRDSRDTNTDDRDSILATPEPARVEDKLQTNKQTKKQDTADFVAELSDILDADRVQALVDVRGKKGGKLNAHSARLLKAKIFASGLYPSDAADTMALRNWISIEPSWLAGRTQQSTAPPKKVTVASMWRDEGRKLGILPNEPPHEINGRLDTSLGDRPAPSSNFARRIAGAGSG